MPDHESYPFPVLHARIAQLAAAGREAEREAAAWDLADRIAHIREQGFSPFRAGARATCARLRYPVIEAN